MAPRIIELDNGTEDKAGPYCRPPNGEGGDPGPNHCPMSSSPVDLGRAPAMGEMGASGRLNSVAVRSRLGGGALVGGSRLINRRTSSSSGGGASWGNQLGCGCGTCSGYLSGDGRCQVTIGPGGRGGSGVLRSKTSCLDTSGVIKLTTSGFLITSALASAMALSSHVGS